MSEVTKARAEFDMAQNHSVRWADRGEWFERHAEPLLSSAEALEAQLVMAREALWNAAEVLAHQEGQEGDAEISARFAEQQCRNALTQLGEPT
jgi:hypothetical protein